MTFRLWRCLIFLLPSVTLWISGVSPSCFLKAEVRLAIGSQDFLLCWFFWSPLLEHGISCMPGGWTMPLNTSSTLLPPNGQGLDIAQGKCTSSRGQSLWRANVQNCANGAVAVTTIAVNLRYFVSTPEDRRCVERWFAGLRCRFFCHICKLT